MVVRNLLTRVFKISFNLRAFTIYFLAHTTPSQKGWAEFKHHHIMETSLALLFHAHLPSSMWVEAFSATMYIIIRLLSSLLHGISLFESLFGMPPNYANFFLFGCRVIPCLQDYFSNNFYHVTVYVSSFDIPLHIRVFGAWI